MLRRSLSYAKIMQIECRISSLLEYYAETQLILCKDNYFSVQHCCIPHYRKLFILKEILVKIKIRITVRIHIICESRQLSSIFLCWPTKALLPVYKSADFDHFQQFILTWRCDILQILRDQLRPHAILCHIFHSKRICNWRLLDINDLSYFHRARRFDIYSRHRHASFFTSFSGNCPRFKNPRSPKPFIYSDIFHLFKSLFSFYILPKNFHTAKIAIIFVPSTITMFSNPDT